MRCRWTRTASTTSRDVPKFLAAARAEPDAVICGRPVFDASIPRCASCRATSRMRWCGCRPCRSAPVRDSMCGFRLYPLRTVLEVVDRDGVGRRMDFDVELLVKLVWRGRTLRWIDTRVSYPTGRHLPFPHAVRQPAAGGHARAAGARHVVARALCSSGAPAAQLPGRSRRIRRNAETFRHQRTNHLRSRVRGRRPRAGGLAWPLPAVPGKRPLGADAHSSASTCRT